MAKSSSNPGVRTPLARLGRKRVLVVDDDRDSREALGVLLGQAGMNVALAGSVREALRIVPDFSPSVVLSDIAMPDEDGFALIQALRQRERNTGKRLTAIAVTALAEPDFRRRALSAGFDACFLKPVAPAAVVSAVVQAAR
jgi:CheY-like chemotaxis protein